MKTKIIEKLKELEEEYGIKIIMAVESGSRAWGMASKDSDYDVRFVYTYPIEKYLSIFGAKDSINRVFEDINADFVGFDVRKFVSMLSASNPTVIEWLNSDILYYGEQNKVFKEWANLKFNAISLFHHYKSMCKQNYKEYIEQNKKVTLKKYLYVMRGLVNASWVFEKNCLPKIKLEDTAKGHILPQKILATVLDIIENKKAQREMDVEQRIPYLDKFIEAFLESKSEPQKRTYERPYALDTELRRIILG